MVDQVFFDSGFCFIFFLTNFSCFFVLYHKWCEALFRFGVKYFCVNHVSDFGACLSCNLACIKSVYASD